MFTEFWPQFLVQAAATAVGGLFSAAVALLLFRLEDRRRQMSETAQRAQHDADSANSERERLRQVRASAVARVAVAVRTLLFLPDEVEDEHRERAELEDALMQLLLEGTDESLVVNSWVASKTDGWSLRRMLSPELRPELAYEAVRAMLVGWVRGDRGTIEAMRRELTNGER